MRFFLLRFSLIILILSGTLETTAKGVLAARQDPFLSSPGDAAAPASSFQIFLPVALQSDRFGETPAIWSHDGTAAASEVSLFRGSLHLDEPLQGSKLRIFADTRYEVWVDGEFLGRGPARFARTLREYDLYPLGALPDGDHLIAILVQWAPSVRRSESITPFLQVAVAGPASNGADKLLISDENWKVQLSSAWRSDAVPVHLWNLIGPTELLDLRQLPANWYQPGYNDAAWENAVVKDISHPEFQPMRVGRASQLELPPASSPAAQPQAVTLPSEIEGVTYRPRSIPMPVSIPITATVVETGLLSPGFGVAELLQPVTETYSLPISVTQVTSFTLETVAIGPPNPSAFLLDGVSLDWTPAGLSRPDVYAAQVTLDEQPHELLLSQKSETGMTFSLSLTNTVDLSLPFQQGVHAGRRLLLANPVRDEEAVAVNTSDGLALEFTRTPAYVVLDLGRTHYGRLTAQASGSPGSIVDIGWDERLSTPAKRPLPYPGSPHPQWNQVDSWILDSSERALTTIDTRAGRYILIAAWGPGTVRLKGIQVEEERAGLELRGSFASSDNLLNKIWALGAETVLPNTTDAYAEPWRERGQWWGDAFVVDRVNQVAYGEDAILVRGIQFMKEAMKLDDAPAMAPANYGHHLLDYSMLWVQMGVQYYQRTQDRGLLYEIYPEIIRFMQHLASHENSETGLLDLLKESWSQTAYIETRAVDSRYGQSTALNAMYYGTLLSAAQAADIQGDRDQADYWREKAEAVRLEVNELLYSAETHAYYTTLYGGIYVDPGPHAQAWALAYGLMDDEEEIKLIAGKLIGMLPSGAPIPPVDIYGMYWVLEALGQAGKIPEALNKIRSEYGGLINLGATTWWETFTSNQYLDSSLSHGWGSAPTWFLTSYVLGARQTGPDRWLVKPSFSGVRSASGAMPLGDGSLQVSWENISCALTTLGVETAPGTQGQIILPPPVESTVITLNGVTVWADGASLVSYLSVEPDGLHLLLGGGSYQATIGQDCAAP